MTMTELFLDLQIACQNATDIADESQITKWLQRVFAASGQTGDVSLTVRLVDANESQQLNAQYRQKDAPTNVLSFPFECEDAQMLAQLDGYLGDMVICTDVVRQEADAQGKIFNAHFAHMVIHGALHLCGFDHIDPDDAKQMEALEIAVLAEFSIANPYEIDSSQTNS